MKNNVLRKIEYLNVGMSIIVCYSGKKDYIYNLVEHLCVNFSNRKDEVIVVNDSSNGIDELQGLKQYSYNSNKITIYDTEYDKTKNNMVKCRNFGAKHAINPLLLFMDEDMLPTSGLMSYYKYDLLTSEINLVVGRIEWEQLNGGLKRDYRINKKIEKKSMPTVYNILANYGKGGGGNFAISKGVFNEVDGFSEEFNGSWGNEDIDLFNKVIEAGYDIYYDYYALANHRYHERNVDGSSKNYDLFIKKWGSRCPQTKKEENS